MNKNRQALIDLLLTTGQADYATAVKYAEQMYPSDGSVGTYTPISTGGTAIQTPLGTIGSNVYGPIQPVGLKTTPSTTTTTTTPADSQKEVQQFVETPAKYQKGGWIDALTRDYMSEETREKATTSSLEWNGLNVYTDNVSQMVKSGQVKEGEAVRAIYAYAMKTWPENANSYDDLVKRSEFIDTAIKNAKLEKTRDAYFKTAEGMKFLKEMGL